MKKLLLTTFLGIIQIALISQSIIEITSLNQSQAIPINTIKEISWNSTGVNNVKLEYTSNFNLNFNSPNDWHIIISSTAANTGSYHWIVPNEILGSARIRISDVDNENIYDINDMDFSTYDAVTNPKHLKITSPNGGEIFDTVSTWHNITFKNENHFSEVEFDYTDDNGVNWYPIDTLIYNGFETSMFHSVFRCYNWKIPNVISDRCKVRIRDKFDHSIFDESDSDFIIFPNVSKNIEVLSLNIAEQLPIATIKEISWNSTGVNNVKLEYTSNFNLNFNSPNDWHIIISSTAANTGSYHWIVPNEILGSARIRISDVDNENIYDINDMDFSTYDAVTNPKHLKITSPNGGEILIGESTFFNITFKYQNIFSEVEFDYSEDNGTIWHPIEMLIYGGFETSMFHSLFRCYNWKVPIAYSDRCKVRIRDKFDHSIFDESDMVFSILKDTTTSIILLEKTPLVKVYPNPTNQQVNVRSNCHIKNIFIFNQKGQCVLQSTDIYEAEVTFDISKLLRGIYILNVLTEKGIKSMELIKY